MRKVTKLAGLGAGGRGKHQYGLSFTCCEKLFPRQRGEHRRSNNAQARSYSWMLVYSQKDLRERET